MKLSELDSRLYKGKMTNSTSIAVLKFFVDFGLIKEQFRVALLSIHLGLQYLKR